MRVERAGMHAPGRTGLVQGLAPRERASVRLGHPPVVRDDRRTHRLLPGGERDAPRARARPRPRSPGRPERRLHRRGHAGLLARQGDRGLERPRLRRLRRRDPPAAVRRPDRRPRRTAPASTCRPSCRSMASKASVDRRRDGHLHGDARQQRHREALEQPGQRADRRAPATARVGLERPRDDGRRVRRRHLHGERQRLGDPRLPGRVPQARRTRASADRRAPRRP